MVFSKYDRVISLGTTCQTAHQLRRLGVRGSAGPLDWFITPFSSLLLLLKSNFHDFMARPNLQIIGEHEKRNFIVRDTKYQIDSYHDFPVSDSIDASYPTFHARVTRRVGRLREDLRSVNAMLFVINAANVDLAGYTELLESLRALRHDRQFTLLGNGYRLPVVPPGHPNLLLYRFRQIKRPGADPHWRRGCDEEWDKCWQAVNGERTYA